MDQRVQADNPLASGVDRPISAAPVVAVSGTPVAELPSPTGRPRPRMPGFLRRHNLQLWVGFIIVGTIVLMAILAPVLSGGHDPTAQSLQDAWLPPGGDHFLGTDQLGRDIWARLLYGARIDLFVAVIAVAVPFLLGSILGALAGYFGGWIDIVVSRVSEIVVAFPFFVLIITLVFVMGNGLVSVFVAISLVSWVAYSRIVRGETMVLRDQEFISACRASGLSHWRVITRHVLPNVQVQAIVYAMSDIVLNIGVIVTLSYFGLGIVPPTPDWGQMMNDGQQFLLMGKYGLVVFPAIAIVLVSLGLACIGAGLAQALKVRR